MISQQHAGSAPVPPAPASAIAELARAGIHGKCQERYLRSDTVRLALSGGLVLARAEIDELQDAVDELQTRGDLLDRLLELSASERFSQDELERARRALCRLGIRGTAQLEILRYDLLISALSCGLIDTAGQMSGMLEALRAGQGDDGRDRLV